MRKRLLAVMMVVALLFVFAGCATVAEKWEALTPDQKARVIISDFQDQLDNLFHVGKTYVEANPEAIEAWKTDVVPVISTANKTLSHLMELAQIKDVTPDVVYEKMTPLIEDITALLVQLGAIT